ncbi:MAG: helix-turn-helix domain-containing protein [Dehalococcoidia bacterium]|nr:helix-turn-helix domain-containing protein [Dehalococcoidia bacterium]
MNTSSTYVTVREAAEILKVSRCTLYNLIRAGRIPVIVLGPRTRRISIEHLDDELRRQAGRVGDDAA